MWDFFFYIMVSKVNMFIRALKNNSTKYIRKKKRMKKTDVSTLLDTNIKMSLKEVCRYENNRL
jgi:hypothetical protein